MKTLLLFVTILGLFLPAGFEDHQSDFTGGGDVTIVDQVVLLTTVNDPTEDILDIKLYKSGFLTLTIAGCGGSTCRNNVSSLATGTYRVFVTTNAGTFSDSVTR